MKLLHTSDWHLGHTLHGLSREHEHARFLAWLLETLEAERPDALLITGDIYETATPPVRAERTFFRFLADARKALPELDVVVIGGNHDSAQRLDSPRDLLRELGVHVVGSLGRRPGRELDLDLERLVLPLTRAGGEVGAWIAAIPFLRPIDLPPVEAGYDPLVEGVRQVYAAAFDAARARCAPGQALLATGHAYLTGTRLSELSERAVLGGNQHALPVDLFPSDVAYAALGHLHKPQAVGDREGVRYAGSPIPLSLAEVDYAHQVVVVELSGATLDAVRALPVPRAVDMLRLPAAGPAPLDAVLPLLAELPARDEATAEVERPYLEVRLQTEGPSPGLRQQVEDALAGKQARLVKLSVTRHEQGAALADVAPQAQLTDLDPAEVFARCYRRAHDDDPPADYVAAFAELLEEVRGDADLDADHALPTLAQPRRAAAPHEAKSSA